MIKIKKKKPMPMWQKVFYVISFIFLIGAFIYLGTKNYNTPIKKLSDAESFSREYGISVNNKYKYADGKEVLQILKDGDGIIFMAYPDNDWAKIYSSLLNNAVKNLDIKEIYYYNFYKDRQNMTHVYQDIVSELKSHLPVIDKDTQHIYAPVLVLVKNGEILYYDDETAVRTGGIETDEYWTMDNRLNKEEELKIILTHYIEDVYAD